MSYAPPAIEEETLVTVPVDKVQPESMRVPIGEALSLLEACVDEGVIWRNLYDAEPVDHTPQALQTRLAAALERWANNSSSALSRIYVSSAAALRFAATEPEQRAAPQEVHLRNVFNRRCNALLDIRDQLLELRERVSAAATDLADRIALHNELLSEIRAASGFTQELWQEVVAKPALASPIARLLNYGISQNAIWDLLKLTLTALYFAM